AHAAKCIGSEAVVPENAVRGRKRARPWIAAQEPTVGEPADGGVELFLTGRALWRAFLFVEEADAELVAAHAPGFRQAEFGWFLRDQRAGREIELAENEKRDLFVQLLEPAHGGHGFFVRLRWKIGEAHGFDRDARIREMRHHLADFLDGAALVDQL